MNGGIIRGAKTQIGDIAYLYQAFPWTAATKTALGRVCTIVARRHGITPKPLAFWLEIIGLKVEAQTAPREWNLRPYLVRKEGCFVDVGACLGLHSIYVSQLGIESFVFEPDPRAFKILQRTVPKAHLYPFAVGDEDRKQATFAMQNDYSRGHLPGTATNLEADQSYCQVRLVRLDSMNLPKVGVVKIDTEGWELPVLRGATELIRRDRPRVITEIHRPYAEQAERIIAFMRKLDYTRIRQIRKPTKNQYHLVFFEPQDTLETPN